MFRPQYGEMLRSIGLLELQPSHDSPGSQFTLTKTLDNGNACGVPKALKEVGFKFSNGVMHIYIRNFEYSSYVQDVSVASA